MAAYHSFSRVFHYYSWIWEYFRSTTVGLLYSEISHYRKYSQKGINTSKVTERTVWNVVLHNTNHEFLLHTLVFVTFIAFSHIWYIFLSYCFGRFKCSWLLTWQCAYKYFKVKYWCAGLVGWAIHQPRGSVFDESNESYKFDL